MIRLKSKHILTAPIIFLLFFSLTGLAFGAPEFIFRPTSQVVSGGEEYTIEVLIDSDGEDITKARAVVTFDPTLARMVKAERNNLLFDQFPSNEQSTDNTNGVFMLTGFTQSGNGQLYRTTGEPDVFARVTFKPLWDGDVEYGLEYSGSDEPFKSVIMVDGSPPTNQLDPTSARNTTATITLINTNDDDDDEIPATGIIDNTPALIGAAAIIGGISIFMGGGILYQYSETFSRNRKRMVVDIGDDN